MKLDLDKFTPVFEEAIRVCIPVGKTSRQGDEIVSKGWLASEGRSGEVHLSYPSSLREGRVAQVIPRELML